VTGRPIRILEVRSVRGTGGGPEKTILQGARRADPARFAVTVCYLRDKRDQEFTLDQRARDLGLDYVEILERHSFDPAIWPQLTALVKQRGIDLVHAHEYKTNVLTWLLARRRPIVPLSTIHGWFGRDTWKERVYYGIDKRVLTRFPRLIAVSDALAKELIAAGCHPDRVTVIPNGIDQRVFKRDRRRRDEIRSRLALTPDDVVIGAVGRLEKQKRFDVLMEAVARLRARAPHLRLLIAGAGGLDQELRDLHTRLGLEQACTLLGHRTDIIDLHHAFDMFVQASDREGSPNVVLEAMAIETPIITTNAGGTGDLITDHEDGLIVPHGDVDAMQRAILEILDNPAAAQARAEHARGRVENEFSFDRRMDRVEAIYEELMQR